MAESIFGLFKTDLHRNPAALATNGGPWRGLDDLEIATCGWVSWFNDERIHGNSAASPRQNSKTSTIVTSTQATRPKLKPPRLRETRGASKTWKSVLDD